MRSKKAPKKPLSRGTSSLPKRRVRRPNLCDLRAERLEARALLAPFLVSSMADEGPDSLRDAISQANSAPGPDEIVFAGSTNGTLLNMASGPFQITESLAITGNGTGNTIIDAQTISRIFDLTNAAGDVTISGVTLINGVVAGAGGARGR